MSNVVAAFSYRVVGEDSPEALRTVMGEAQGISLPFVIAVLWRGASFAKAAAGKIRIELVNASGGRSSVFSR